MERDTLRDQRRAEDAGAEDRQDDQLDEHDGSEGHEDGGDERPTTTGHVEGEPAEEPTGEDDAGCDPQGQQAFREGAEGGDHELEDIQREVAAEAVGDDLDEARPIGDEPAEHEDQQRRPGGGKAGQEHATSRRWWHDH